MLQFSNRPISPHFTVYSPHNSSLLSIWHRISGILLSIFLYLGFCLLKLSIWWISFQFNQITTYIWISHLVFTIIYFILLISLLYHLINGLRHLINDFQIPINYYKFKVYCIT